MNAQNLPRCKSRRGQTQSQSMLESPSCMSQSSTTIEGNNQDNNERSVTETLSQPVVSERDRIPDPTGGVGGTEARSVSACPSCCPHYIDDVNRNVLQFATSSSMIDFLFESDNLCSKPEQEGRKEKDGNVLVEVVESAVQVVKSAASIAIGFVFESEAPNLCDGVCEQTLPDENNGKVVVDEQNKAQALREVSCDQESCPDNYSPSGIPLALPSGSRHVGQPLQQNYIPDKNNGTVVVDEQNAPTLGDLSCDQKSCSAENNYCQLPSIGSRHAGQPLQQNFSTVRVVYFDADADTEQRTEPPFKTENSEKHLWMGEDLPTSVMEEVPAELYELPSTADKQSMTEVLWIGEKPPSPSPLGRQPLAEEALLLTPPETKSQAEGTKTPLITDTVPESQFITGSSCSIFVKLLADATELDLSDASKFPLIAEAIEENSQPLAAPEQGALAAKELFGQGSAAESVLPLNYGNGPVKVSDENSKQNDSETGPSERSTSPSEIYETVIDYIEEEMPLQEYLAMKSQDISAQSVTEYSPDSNKFKITWIELSNDKDNPETVLEVCGHVITLPPGIPKEYLKDELNKLHQKSVDLEDTLQLLSSMASSGKPTVSSIEQGGSDNEKPIPDLTTKVTFTKEIKFRSKRSDSADSVKTVTMECNLIDVQCSVSKTSTKTLDFDGKVINLEGHPLGPLCDKVAEIETAMETVPNDFRILLKKTNEEKEVVLVTNFVREDKISEIDNSLQTTGSTAPKLLTNYEVQYCEVHTDDLNLTKYFRDYSKIAQLKQSGSPKLELQKIWSFNEKEEESTGSPSSEDEVSDEIPSVGSHTRVLEWLEQIPSSPETLSSDADRRKTPPSHKSTPGARHRRTRSTKFWSPVRFFLWLGNLSIFKWCPKEKADANASEDQDQLKRDSNSEDFFIEREPHSIQVNGTHLGNLRTDVKSALKRISIALNEDPGRERTSKDKMELQDELFQTRSLEEIKMLSDLISERQGSKNHKMRTIFSYRKQNPTGATPGREPNPENVVSFWQRLIRAWRPSNSTRRHQHQQYNLGSDLDFPNLPNPNPPRPPRTGLARVGHRILNMFGFGRSNRVFPEPEQSDENMQNEVHGSAHANQFREAERALGSIAHQTTLRHRTQLLELSLLR